MSENLDLVRSIYADWERGEFGVVGWANPDIEFVFDGGPSPGTWTGFVDIAGAMRDLLDAWSDFQVKDEEYRELDNERVLVLSNLGGPARQAGFRLDRCGRRNASCFRYGPGR